MMEDPPEQDEICYWLFFNGESDAGLIDQESLFDTALELSQSYIWNRETFQLQAPASSLDTDISNGLYGRTRIGDCQEDEWFIIYLLMELSARFPIAIRVADFDGDPIMIEGADFLPEWVDDEVYLADGSVHLIPIDCCFPSRIATMELGAQIVCSNLSVTRSTPLTRVIRKRCERFASRPFDEMWHRCSFNLPASYALIARYRPDLVAAGISLLRTAPSVRLQMAGARSPSLETLCTVSGVQVTRHQFLSLCTSKLIPDRRSSFFRCTDEMSLRSYRVFCALEMLHSGIVLPTSNIHTCLHLEQLMTDMMETDRKRRYHGEEWSASQSLLNQLQYIPDNAIQLLQDVQHVSNDEDGWLNVDSEELLLGLNEFAYGTRDDFADCSTEEMIQNLGDEVNNFLTERDGDNNGNEDHLSRKEKMSNGMVEMEFDDLKDAMARILALEKQQSDEANADYGSASDCSDTEYGRERNTFNVYMEAMDRKVRRKTHMNGQNIRHNQPEQMALEERRFDGEMFSSVMANKTEPGLPLVIGDRRARLAEHDSDDEIESNQTPIGVKKTNQTPIGVSIEKDVGIEKDTV